MNQKTAPKQMHGTDYITRQEAIDLLGVKSATLYTYVSRGWIRRLPHPDKKQSLYFREDVERIRVRSDARSQEGVVAAGALRFGEPIIPTAITELTPAGQKYRNRSAIELAKGGCTFESTAELLWSGIWIDAPVTWKLESLPDEFLHLANSLGKLQTQGNIHELFSIATLALGMHKGSLTERIKQGSTLVLSARQLIQAMTGCLGFLTKKHAYRPPKDGESIAEALARSLALAPSPEILRVLNAALALCADHELNPATFAARVTASSEADIHSCIAAAICTHSGARMAQACDRLEDFFTSGTTKAQLLKKMITLEKTSQAIPGFNHPIYQKSDPRATCLLDIIKETIPPTKPLKEIYGFLDEAASRLQVYPRVEVAIVVLAIALGMPAGSAAGLYTFSRTAGWVAHVMEQRLSGFLIRPRAKYVGGPNTVS